MLTTLQRLVAKRQGFADDSGSNNRKDVHPEEVVPPRPFSLRTALNTRETAALHQAKRRYRAAVPNARSNDASVDWFILTDHPSGNAAQNQPQTSPGSGREVGLPRCVVVRMDAAKRRPEVRGQQQWSFVQSLAVVSRWDRSFCSPKSTVVPAADSKTINDPRAVDITSAHDASTAAVDDSPRDERPAALSSPRRVSRERERRRNYRRSRSRTRSPRGGGRRESCTPPRRGRDDDRRR